ncbi:lysophospholipid acyltransferase family protein [Micromonospora mirobrigensis]|uniref:1-acyl-sn-glycerol-3-phosphate acyltransferases n=1 Tax=Micromonospora mirobrigensis TaxID=262898 RepID=A0A1C4YI58_9ACTN|nr:lysophospholipid acyltransferase family protein [Micromonospora mirobrigensis]SCF20021.1 1-acyl-sn-glycerol-3-phosphate acyltransferases [Micromonospora mirobrigensis]
MTTTPHPWRPPLIWRAALLLARAAVAALARLEVSGDVPERLRRGPLILAANHISPFDPVVLAAACATRGVAPRIMATGGLFRAPVIGSLMRRAGHLRVDRGTAAVHRALDDAASAAAAGSVILVYPEGRIGLDPGMWPERGKTGAARLALACGAPVIPVAQWGSHEILPYRAPKGALRGIARSLLRRPVVRVRFGEPLDLHDLPPGAPGTARRGTDRIIDAITDTLAPLRPDEPDRPRHVDPGRPVDTSRAHRRRPPD